MEIVAADLTNINAWADLSHRLFPKHTLEEMQEDCRGFLASGKESGFLARLEGEYVAFMNVSVRHDYVNGTNTSPVMFIEAIYVLPEHRKQGIARKLIERADRYAKEKGITQIGSDCLLDNTDSELFHKSCGFMEAERVICFVKDV